jgi:transglutaminase-like putative cysteine protease
MVRIRAGFEIAFDCPEPTPMILQLEIHPSRTADLLTPGTIHFDPPVPATTYTDGFGNICNRVTAPRGRFGMTATVDVQDPGLPDPVLPGTPAHLVGDLPDDALVFLLGSRYCDTDRLNDVAWARFGNGPVGWDRVQAVCDFVHRHIRFDYMQARDTRTAHDGYMEAVGVCRDYAHLAIALCRCLNIPARYCTGYLAPIGLTPPYPEADFTAWFEAYLDGQWRTFDPRHNTPRTGRILIARGRDATDCAISTTFGRTTLAAFTVTCDVVAELDSYSAGALR